MDAADIRILIAEDDEQLRKLLVTVLIRENYQVDSVANGLEAWELMQKNYYDLLLTDQFMPKMSGMELIRKCQQAHPTTKTVLLCGGGRGLRADHGSQQVKLLDQEITVDKYLIKPTRLQELLTVLEDLLQSQEQFKEPAD